MSLYKLVEQDGETFAIPDPEASRKQRQLKYDLFLQKSGIPEFYWDIDFKDYKGDHTSETFRKIKFYADNCYKEEFKHVNLYLEGKHSTQKTALACNILKEAMRNGLRAKFILAGTLINKLMKLQGFNTSDAIQEEIEDLKQCDIICIDDVGDIDKSMQWSNSSLINVEWDNFLRTILASKTKIIMTSNFSIEIFQQHFSESLFQLIDRNTIKFQLLESVKEARKFDLNRVFDKQFKQEEKKGG